SRILFLFLVFSLPLFAREFHKAKILCKLQDEQLEEVSGMVAGRNCPHLFWLHNDSGDGPYIYGVNHKGQKVVTLILQNGRAIDWEDISMGNYKNQSCIFAGDIGDNDYIRKSVQIYIVPEPTSQDVSQKKEITLSAIKILNITYPDGPHNAEALFIDPKGNLYVVEKKKSSFANIYTLSVRDFDLPKPVFKKYFILDLKKIAGRRSKRGYQVTAGDLSPDGKSLLLRGYRWAAEIDWPIKGKIRSKRIYIPRQPQGEAICYITKNRIAITSEKSFQPIYVLERISHEPSK
ncbi:MAG: hypothetical protein D6785_16480, partial [Planctomycetota bacterium]